MKKSGFIVFLLGLGALRASAQVPFPVEEGTRKITYTEVVTIDKVKKGELLKRAQSWAAGGQYAPAKQQVADQYQCRGQVKVSYPSITAGKTDKGLVTYSAAVYCKDGKYKYVLTDFSHQGLDGRGDGGALENSTPACGKFILSLASWNKIKEQTHAEAENAVASLKAALEKGPAPPAKKPTDF
ncbi:MAG: DUF4468 domain-containing protein [Ferruginibacter sp.]|nr:DUF4468 domain-containing protein [Cytophagales bacterium]